MVRDFPAGDRKIADLFLQCTYSNKLLGFQRGHIVMGVTTEELKVRWKLGDFIWKLHAKMLKNKGFQCVIN